MWPTSGLPGSCRPQVGPMLVTWTLLSGSQIGSHTKCCGVWNWTLISYFLGTTLIRNSIHVKKYYATRYMNYAVVEHIAYTDALWTALQQPSYYLNMLWLCFKKIDLCFLFSNCINIGYHIQYIPINMHTVFALLCFVVVIHWLIFPYPSGLLHWHCGNLTIAPVPSKQPWWIWINASCEFIMNDCITTTKQSTTKPCAYFMGYTVLWYLYFTKFVIPVGQCHIIKCVGAL